MARPTGNGGCHEASSAGDVRAGGWGAFWEPGPRDGLGGQLSQMVHGSPRRGVGKFAKRMAGAGGPLDRSLPHGNTGDPLVRSITLHSVANCPTCRGARLSKWRASRVAMPGTTRPVRILAATLLAVACNPQADAPIFVPAKVGSELHLVEYSSSSLLEADGIIVALDLGFDGYAVGLDRTSNIAVQLHRTLTETSATSIHRGAGPLDVGYADAIRMTKLGVLIFDRAQSRLSMFDFDGQLVRETPITRAVGWPTVLEDSGVLHWLRPGESRMLLASWTSGQGVREIETPILSSERVGTALANIDPSNFLIYGGSRHCFWKVQSGSATTHLLGCLPDAIFRLLAPSPDSSSDRFSSRQRITRLVGMNRPHLVAFGADSAAILIDRPSSQGVQGVMVRFGDTTASTIRPEHPDTTTLFTIFIASAVTSGGFVVSDGYEIRSAQVLPLLLPKVGREPK